MFSAESREFSSSSRRVVYRLLPACKPQSGVGDTCLQVGRPCRNAQLYIAAILVQRWTHVVEASDVLVLCEELSWALLLEHIRARLRSLHHL